MSFFDAWLEKYVAACSPAVKESVTELKASMNAGKERMMRDQSQE